VLLQKAQHVVPAAGLLIVAAQTIGEGAHGAPLAIAVAEIVVVSLVLLAYLRGIRAARRHAAPEHRAHAVDWIDIWLAGVMFVEIAERWHLGRKRWSPTLLLAIATLTVGLLHGRIAARAARRRSLRLTDEDLVVGGPPFRTFRARWSDIAGIDLGDRDAAIRTRDGRTRRLNLADLDHADAVRGALAEARRRVQPNES